MKISALFDDQYERAKNWLLKAQHENDGGWGDTGYDPISTVVNTAESVLCLLICGEPSNSSAIQKGMNFIFQQFETKEKFQALSARELAWAGLAIAEIAGADSEKFETILTRLAKLQNKVEGHWDNGSVYSTSMVLRLLAKLEHSSSIDQQLAIKWLLRVPREPGWGWFRNFAPNAACSAHVIISLSSLGIKDIKLEKASRFLRESSTEKRTEVSIEPFDIRQVRTGFRHFTLAWILVAMLSQDEVPWKEVREGIRRLLALQDDGFRANTTDFVRVWATHNAVHALSVFEHKFKPLNVLELLDERSEIEQHVYQQIARRNVYLSKKADLAFSKRASFIFLFASILALFVASMLISSRYGTLWISSYALSSFFSGLLALRLYTTISGKTLIIVCLVILPALFLFSSLIGEMEPVLSWLKEYAAVASIAVSLAALLVGPGVLLKIRKPRKTSDK